MEDHAIEELVRARKTKLLTAIGDSFASRVITKVPTSVLTVALYVFEVSIVRAGAFGVLGLRERRRRAGRASRGHRHSVGCGLVGRGRSGRRRRARGGSGGRSDADVAAAEPSGKSDDPDDDDRDETDDREPADGGLAFALTLQFREPGGTGGLLPSAFFLPGHGGTPYRSVRGGSERLGGRFRPGRVRPLASARVGLVVQKFGGTSVGDTDRMRAVADHVARTKSHGDDVVVVVSAMGRTTDDLLRLAAEASDVQPPRELDMLLTSGERVSMALLCMALAACGVEGVSFTGSQAGIVTDTDHTRAKILEVRPERLQEALSMGQVPVVAGFQGVSTGQRRDDPRPGRVRRDRGGARGGPRSGRLRDIYRRLRSVQCRPADRP